MELGITFDSKELDRLHDLFEFSEDDMFNKARVAALKRTAQNMRKNIRKGLKAASFLAGQDLTRAVGTIHLSAGNIIASVTVKGSKKVAHKFRMSPNRITARKGQRSVNWQVPLVKIGPGEKDVEPRIAGFSKPFIARTRKRPKAMYVREKMSGNLLMPKIASPQYFAAFDKVKDPVMAEAERTFMERLDHEIDYRLRLTR